MILNEIKKIATAPKSLFLSANKYVTIRNPPRKINQMENAKIIVVLCIRSKNSIRAYIHIQFNCLVSLTLYPNYHFIALQASHLPPDETRKDNKGSFAKKTFLCYKYIYQLSESYKVTTAQMFFFYGYESLK